MRFLRGLLMCKQVANTLADDFDIMSLMAGFGIDGTSPGNGSGCGADLLGIDFGNLNNSVGVVSTSSVQSPPLAPRQDVGNLYNSVGVASTSSVQSPPLAPHQDVLDLSLDRWISTSGPAPAPDDFLFPPTSLPVSSSHPMTHHFFAAAAADTPTGITSSFPQQSAQSRPGLRNLELDIFGDVILSPTQSPGVHQGSNQQPMLL
jgi:hypothetical protein